MPKEIVGKMVNAVLGENDWRLQGQEKYLLGKTLYKRTRVAPRENWDHDHCEFCWKKFGDFDDALNEVWTTEDEYRWICDDCRTDFQQMFAWTLVGRPTGEN
jgi:hypothetical protein